MTVENMLVETLLGIAALALTYFTWYFRTQRNEAWVWGDNFLDTSRKMANAIVAMSVIYPPIKPLAMKVEILLDDLEMAWNDEESTKEEMKEIVGDIESIYNEALELISKYKK